MSFYEVWNDLLIIFRIILCYILDFIIAMIRFIENKLVTYRNENSDDEIALAIACAINRAQKA